jgi:hypothetical protein
VSKRTPSDPSDKDGSQRPQQQPPQLDWKISQITAQDVDSPKEQKDLTEVIDASQYGFTDVLDDQSPLSKLDCYVFGELK